MARHLKIGDKVRHIESNMEGHVAYSSFGLSVNGWIYEGDELIHVKTLGMAREELGKQWKRVYKWKYDMLRYEQERVKRNENTN
ncbi:hypothetical protein ACIQ1D_19205 [Lysinibacillus xylanilyticus]|uniref:hypothetical protein n=1 Tax=Lysinibacillus xylanilyticus TaxID=582475 RepID=UPI00380CB044